MPPPSFDLRKVSSLVAAQNVGLIHLDLPLRPDQIYIHRINGHCAAELKERSLTRAGTHHATPPAVDRPELDIQGLLWPFFPSQRQIQTTKIFCQNRKTDVVRAFSAEGGPLKRSDILKPADVLTRQEDQEM